MTVLKFQQKTDPIAVETLSIPTDENYQMRIPVPTAQAIASGNAPISSLEDLFWRNLLAEFLYKRGFDVE